MPRIRTIKPEMPSDEKLATVCRDARLTFAYLITQADDDGLIPATPRQLLGALFPHDADVTEAMVTTWVHALTTIGAVRWRKTRGGAPVLELVNWHAHQKIKHPAKPVLALSLIPHADTDSAAGHASGTAPERRGRMAGDPPEDVGRVSPTNQQPTTMDHGPRTMDQRPTTAPGGPTAGVVVVDPANAAHCVRLVVAANRGITATHGERPTPFTAGHAGTTRCADALAKAAVPLAVAERALFEAARDCQPGNGKLPTSLRYFEAAVIAAWQAEQARRDLASAPSLESTAGRRTDDADDMAAMERRIAAGEFLALGAA